MTGEPTEKGYPLAKERYAELGVDVEGALRTLSTISVSLQCWQGDDVGGFENPGAALGGGLAVTGNYPGKARTPAELRADIEKAFNLIPGKHRFNLHASYLDSDQKPERTDIRPEHFKSWIDWAKGLSIGLDFNPTCFGHPNAEEGFTLSHPDPSIRKFWIDHCIACRRIGAAFGRELGTACVTNIWIPDGYKDAPADRKTPRERLKDSLDQVLKEPIEKRFNLDSVEGKLFGIGSESYVVGSHEFYLGYAIANKVLLCIDSGHFHPTESVADKISSVLLYLDQVLLHVSRGVRWDSDHVVTFSDDLRAIAEELVRGDYLSRVRIGLDYFDASINRVAAWTIGARNLLKALLVALLEPTNRLREFETEGNYTARLALLEDLKTMPFGAVWDFYCASHNTPADGKWLAEAVRYEKEVLTKRL